MSRKNPADTATSEKAIDAFVTEVAKSESLVFMGIDSGGSGGLALICDEHYVVVDYPTRVEVREGKLTKKGKPRTRTLPDLWGLLFLFAKLRPIKERIRIALEQAQIQVQGGGDNAYTAYRVCQFYFIFPLFLLGRDYKYVPVRPAVWKAALGVQSPKVSKGQRKTKEQKKGPSVALARKLFPEAEVSLQYDGRADALLLAQFARQSKLEWEKLTYGEV